MRLAATASGCIATWWPRVSPTTWSIPRASKSIREPDGPRPTVSIAGLLSLLARYVLGDQRAWRVVRVPTVAEEDARHLSRTLEALTQDRTRLMSRLKSLLATQGVSLPINAQFLPRLEAAQLWDGTPLPPGLQAATDPHVEAVAGGGWTAARSENAATHATGASDAGDEPPSPSSCRCGRSARSGRRCWRPKSSAGVAFGNRRELGALVGLVPAPYQSGETHYDQGITRAGNAHVRRVIVQLAWGWIRHQPDSALTHWYQQRFGGGGKRVRKSGLSHWHGDY